MIFNHFQNQCELLNCNLLFKVKNENLSGCFEDCQIFILKFKLPSLKIHTVRSDLQQTFACQQMKYSSIEHFSTKLNFEMQKTKTLIKSVKATTKNHPSKRQTQSSNFHRKPLRRWQQQDCRFWGYDFYCI